MGGGGRVSGWGVAGGEGVWSPEVLTLPCPGKGEGSRTPPPIVWGLTVHLCHLGKMGDGSFSFFQPLNSRASMRTLLVAHLGSGKGKIKASL